MGLAERRVQQEFESERIPKRLATFKQEYCPAANLKVEIDWKTFEGDKGGLESLWAHWEQAFSGLEGVCTDDLGKEAVARGVKAILIRNVPSTGDVKAEFKDGTLTVSMAFKEGGNGTPGWTAIKDVVEAGL